MGRSFFRFMVKCQDLGRDLPRGEPQHHTSALDSTT